jgi:hypothetical protein
MTVRITIEPVSTAGLAAEYRHRYRVLRDDAVLIESTWNPEYEAARALLAKGVTGQCEVWRAGKGHPASVMDIERAARLTVIETRKDGPRLAKWRPFAAETFRPGSPSRGLPVSTLLRDPKGAACSPASALASISTWARADHDRNNP